MRGEACAKAILFGEHAVVHGTPAIAIPLAARLRVEVTPTDDSAITVASPDGQVDAALASRGDLPVRMVRLAIEQAHGAGFIARGAHVLVRSEIPIGAGLGSSAAFGVALVRALAGATLLANDEVARRANDIEKLAHGTPSGVDAATVAHQRPVVFRRGEAMRLLASAHRLKLVVAIVPRRASTADLVASVGALEAACDARFTAFLATSTRVAIRAIALLETASARPIETELGALMNESHAALVSVGVSAIAQDALCETLLRAGALGAKLSGAGGGGATLALLPEDDHGAIEAAVLDAARTAGATAAFTTVLANDILRSR